MRKSTKKENRLLGLTMDQLEKIDPCEMQLNNIEIKYAIKRWKEHDKDINWKVAYYKSETDELRNENIELKQKQKIFIKIMKWDNQIIKDLKWNRDTLMSEYIDLQNVIPKWVELSRESEQKIVGHAIPRKEKQWKENLNRLKAKQEEENRELYTLQKQNRGFVNLKHYDPKRKPNKAEQKAAESYVVLHSDELLNRNQKEVFKSFVKNGGDWFLMEEELGKKKATLKATWDRIQETLSKAKYDFIQEMRKKM